MRYLTHPRVHPILRRHLHIRQPALLTRQPVRATHRRAPRIHRHLRRTRRLVQAMFRKIRIRKNQRIPYTDRDTQIF